MPDLNQRHRRFIYNCKDYGELIQFARRRILSEQDYFSFEKFQGTLLVRYLRNMGIAINQGESLDVGCGFGGYSTALREAGSNTIGLDLDSVRISSLPLKVSGDAQWMPFPSESFSLVICSSLIEHVPNPNKLLLEIDRILQHGGYLYLSFPPFFSPTGGHQFAPFHYLGERLAIYIFLHRKKHLNQEWVQRYISSTPKSFSSSFGSWGLYRRTINWAKREIKKYPWRLIDCSARYSPLNPTKVPILSEFLTWHVQFLIQKL
jgi:ubiquinone/menaquinone biosynthesis C-methylase UbiE